MPPQATTTNQPATLDELLEQYVGKTGTVHQPAKGAWLDPKTKKPRVYTVVGGSEEDGRYFLSLESVERMPKTVAIEKRVPGVEGMVTEHLPDGLHPHAAQVVPNCPVKWFRPAS